MMVKLMEDIKDLSFGGGLIKPSMKQNVSFCFLPAEKDLTAKIVMVFGIMREGKYTEKPRSLRFASVAEIDKFIFGAIEARNFYLRKHGAITCFNYGYHYQNFIKEQLPLFTMKQ